MSFRQHRPNTNNNHTSSDPNTNTTATATATTTANSSSIYNNVQYHHDGTLVQLQHYNKRTNGGTLKVVSSSGSGNHQWRRRNVPTTSSSISNSNSISSTPESNIMTLNPTTNHHHGRTTKYQHPHHRGRARTFGMVSSYKTHFLANDSNQLEESLHRTLEQRGIYESLRGSELRKAAVEHLDEILQQWNQAMWLEKQKGKDQEEAEEQEEGQDYYSKDDSTTKTLLGPITATATDTSTDTTATASIKLISFGSYRLGVHSPHADLDLLAICPSYITKNDFFHSFVNVLRQDSSCTGIHPVAKAYTPVIKFQMDGIPIDLLFVRLVNDDCLMDSRKKGEEEQGHELFQIKDEMLQGLDEPSSRSLNGVRVAQYLLSILSTSETDHDNDGGGGGDNNGHSHDHDMHDNVKIKTQGQTQTKHYSFRIVLRTVKEWAKVHGLYSNVLGFLGGINWAILVAWVCKRNPDASIPLLLKIFFHTFARWRWPKPVVLTPIVKNPPQGVAALTIWDPANNPRDRAQIMPIITPCYPSMNSSYNVSLPQLRRVREELYRADKIMDEIGSGDLQWSELFKDNDFFTDHVHYLQIKIISKTQEDHRTWFGLCESRLRILIAGLESGDHGTHAYPFAKFFTRHCDMNDNATVFQKKQNGRMDKEQHEESPRLETQFIATYFFIALRFANGIESVDLIGSCSEFVYSVNSWEGRKEGMDLQINHVLQHDLPTFVYNDDSESRDSDVEDKDPLPNMDDTIAVARNPHLSNHLQCYTLLREMVSPDDCLASPLKKTKIGKA
eukprot:CAMPEP_0176504642 /NCGR_PEP_ID=MMETSP0200_2-20121128/16049_1 /TAXON_ID=947934 /ORGANISM="Chaetoceros sp., Strain GSL56" /LENGTH=785 /DNA_ID=CAMNT_0017904101 /DNA_START=189 /DNA_END=2546 /DNA_ORIENTATION=-